MKTAIEEITEVRDLAILMRSAVSKRAKAITSADNDVDLGMELLCEVSGMTKIIQILECKLSDLKKEDEPTHPKHLI